MEMSHAEKITLPDQCNRTHRSRQFGSSDSSDPALVRSSSNKGLATSCQAGEVIFNATADGMEVDLAVPGPGSIGTAVEQFPTSKTVESQRTIDSLEILSSDENSQSAGRKTMNAQPSLSDMRALTHSFFKDSVLARKSRQSGSIGGAKQTRNRTTTCCQLCRTRTRDPM